MEIKKCKDCASFKRLYYMVFNDYVPTDKWYCVFGRKKNPKPGSTACEIPIKKGGPADPDLIHLRIMY